MKTQLRRLLLSGHPIEIKQAAIKIALEKGLREACEQFVMTRGTINRYLIYKNEIMNHTHESVEKLRNIKRVRSSEYIAKHNKKHSPGKKRKKHPFKVISVYANNNYKLVCFRNGIPFREEDRITALQLWSIAKKQKAKCYYTGLPLTCETMSVDHIIPVTQSGKNTIDNIRLTSKTINRIRNDTVDTEFIENCKLIAKNFPD